MGDDPPPRMPPSKPPPPGEDGGELGVGDEGADVGGESRRS